MDVGADLLSTAVGSKLRSIGYSLPFVWTTFDQVKGIGLFLEFSHSNYLTSITELLAIEVLQQYTLCTLRRLL